MNVELVEQNKQQAVVDPCKVDLARVSAFGIRAHRVRTEACMHT